MKSISLGIVIPKRFHNIASLQIEYQIYYPIWLHSWSQIGHQTWYKI